VPCLDGGKCLSGRVCDLRFELLMQGELLGQGARKVLIVVDNQYIARIAHDCLRKAACSYVYDLSDEPDFRNWRFPVPKLSLAQNKRNRIRKCAVARVLTLSDRDAGGILRFNLHHFHWQGGVQR
jgi:hypothetical protein